MNNVIDVNRLNKSSYEWWCEANNIPLKERYKMSFSEITAYMKHLTHDLTKRIETINDYTSTISRQEAMVDAIRITQAIAWINSVDVNNWIHLNVTMD